MYKPTPQQTDILNCDTNCVVAAGPGSGKTTTLAHKIDMVLKNMRDYQGVVAISYTNKASDALKRKSEDLSAHLKNSFFGTIDSFYISNIIIPFGKQFFGLPIKKITVEKFSSKETLEEIKYFLEEVLMQFKDYSIEELERQNIKPIEQIRPRDFEYISRHFREGHFDVALVGHIANLIFLSSKSCRNYFKARYKYLFIDEFQDSGLEQYLLFLRIAEIGITSWAIGDVNQSIFSFADKSSEYLFRLMENDQFKKLPMNVNHRSHPSIDFYSKKFLKFDIGYEGEIRVFEARIDGNEIDIGVWFERELEKIKQKFDVVNNSDIGVLATKEILLELFAEKLKTPYKLHSKTVLENDKTLWGSLFKKMLDVSLNPNNAIFDFVDVYFDRDLPQDQAKIIKIKRLITTAKELGDNIRNGQSNQIDEVCEIFKDIASIIYPDARNDGSVENLKTLLADENQLNVFFPAETNQVQLMTLFKSKGLEFDVVIHLDMYQFVIPGYDWIVKHDKQKLQDAINLHYVGITRAKKAVIFTIGSERFYTSKKAFGRAVNISVKKSHHSGNE